MNRAHLRILWFFMRPYRFLYGVILLVSLLASVLESVSLAAFFPIFQIVMGQAGGPSGGGLLGALSVAVRRLPCGDPLTAAAVVLVTVMLLKAAFTLAREMLIAHASGTALYALKNRLVRQYADSPYEVFVDTKQGTLLYQCLKAPDTIAFLLLRSPQVLSELMKMTAIIAVLLITWPVATGVLVVIGAGYNWLTQQMARRISYNAGKSRAAAAVEQMHVASEFFRGIRQIIACCTRPAWLAKFEQAGRRYRDLFIKDQVWLAAPVSVMEVTAVFVFTGALMLIRLHGAEQVAARLPMLGVFGMASLRLLYSLTSFGRIKMELAGRLPDAETAYRVITEPPTPRQDGSRVFASLSDRIQFEEVGFAHRGHPPLLQGLSLTVKQGETVAIVGPSGAGKTTLINLLLGFFEAGSGRITIDGVPLTEYRLETWLARVGFVSQDPFLFHGTVAENILFGRSRFSAQDVVRAAHIANAHDFIAGLPQGYDTLVGERGMKLSGGQQQRIAIARAILGEPQVLIFDEATSHLDAVSEQQVQDAIERVAEGRTVILVAHRLSTVQRADRIAVLQDGRVVEEGTHDMLLRRQHHYAHLVGASA